MHEHTLAVYRLLDELKSRHPGLEIESCASGGARVDLGILDRTDRIWTSDSLDPLERLTNQRYTGLVVPPELMGMHLTSPVVHSSGRTVSLGFSGAVALFGHFGIEWDLTSVDDATRKQIADVGRAREAAPPADRDGPRRSRRRHRPGYRCPRHGRRGCGIRRLHHHPDRDVRRVPRRAGADAGARPRPPVPRAGPSTGASGDYPGQSPLAWAQHDTVLTGRELESVGLRPPVQFPQQATVIELIADH